MMQQEKTVLPEKRNIVISKPKGVMIPGKARSSSSTPSMPLRIPEMSNADATFIVNKMLGNLSIFLLIFN